MQNVSTLLELIFKDKEKNIKLWMPLVNILENNNKDEIINFCNIMKNKINGENKPDILLALNLVDLAVDLDKMIIWERIDSKNFLSCIINILNHNHDIDIQSVCKYLIKKLAEKFKNYPSLPNCSNIFKNLKKSKVNFPDSIKHSYINIEESKINNLNKSYTSNNVNNINNNINHIQNNLYHTEYKDLRQSRIPTNPENYLSIINLNPKNYQKKNERLINILNELLNLIQKTNILINNNVSCKNNEEISNSCGRLKISKQTLIKIINNQKYEDGDLISKILLIIEDINMTIERSEKSKKGKDPGPFLTSFTRDNNPNAIKNKIDINKTFNFGDNHKNKLDDINLGESYQTVILNDDGNGNNILENSLNAKFGQIQKSEVIDPKKIQNLNQSNNGSIHVFNSMSQFSDNGDDNNINNSINSNNIQNLIGKNMDILNSSNVMIIGNKIINNKKNINIDLLNNNKLTSKNYFENKGNKNININNGNIQQNKTNINNNTIYNNMNRNININNIQQNNNNIYYTQINPHYTNNSNKYNNKNIKINYINNPKNISNIRTNNNYNNPHINRNFLSKTQYVINHANFNNKNN